MRLHSCFVALILMAASSGCADRTDKDLTTLKVLLDWKPQMEQIGFFAAQHNGYYRKSGFHVELHPGNGATSTATIVAQGSFPVGMSSGGATIIVCSKGADLVSVAVVNQHSPVVIYSLKETGIASPSDLVGKKLGLTPSGVKYWEYVALIRALWIDRSAIDEVSIGKAISPLLSGQVDALLGYTQDQPVLVEMQGHEVSRMAMADYGVDLVSTNLIVNRSALTADSVVIGDFVRATLKGYSWATANPDSAVAIYSAAHPETDRDFNRENFKQLQPILSSPLTDSLGLGWHNMAHWRRTEQILRDQQIITNEVDVEQITTDRFLSAAPEPAE